MVGCCYKGQIYWMGISYSRSYSPGSVSGAGPAGIDPKAICDQIHALNELVQRQLKEVDRRYMELYQRHERDTNFTSRYGVAIRHLLHHLCHRLHRLRLHLHCLTLLYTTTPLEKETTTTMASRILTMISIRRF